MLETYIYKTLRIFLQRFTKKNKSDSAIFKIGIQLKNIHIKCKAINYYIFLNIICSYERALISKLNFPLSFQLHLPSSGTLRIHLQENQHFNN